MNNLNQQPILEVCVSDSTGLAAAIEGGADRIELCAALDCGGLTPGPGMIGMAAEASVPVNVLIRPRAGGFVYDDHEVELMRSDIAFCRQAGVAGVVIGALDETMSLDSAILGQLLSAADGLDVTLHRAFDLTHDPFEAVETAIRLGIPRILTSGQAERAENGLRMIAKLTGYADKRISIMPGSGIHAGNAAAFMAIPDIHALHASCSRPLHTKALKLKGFEAAKPKQVDIASVRALKAAITL